MVPGFILIIGMGHFHCIFLPLFLTICMYRELINLQRDRDKEMKIASKFFKIMTWYYMILSIFYFYFAYFNIRLLTLSPNSTILLFLINYYRIISFTLYTAGLIMFVLSLQNGYYDYQYKIFAWVHLAIMLTIMCSVCFAANINYGMIWFSLPAFLIIINDIGAYLFGVTFGKTPLISVSPKKTWEGFLGGFFCTLVIGLIVFYNERVDSKCNGEV